MCSGYLYEHYLVSFSLPELIAQVVFTAPILGPWEAWLHGYHLGKTGDYGVIDFRG